MRKTNTTRWMMGTLAAALALGGTRLALRAQGDEPLKPGDAAIVLFNNKDTTGWIQREKGHADTWKVVSSVTLDPNDSKKLAGAGEGGGNEAAVLFRQPVEHGTDIYTDKKYGDCELHIEFMVPKGSNSGVYLMGEYEVQVFDSFGKEKLGDGDCAAIYSTAAPTENAAKAPGEWQTFDIVFQAPRFDADGKKTQNAKFISVMWNGKKVQDNVEAPKPTGSELRAKEVAQGPLLLQGNHGIVAFRNITIKPLAPH